MATRNGFFALLSRMANIQRWSKSNPTRAENVAEHSLQVAMFAHALGTIRNQLFPERGLVDANLLSTLALYHDAAEVLTEDVNSLIKYSHDRMLKLCREMESIACDMLSDTLPEELLSVYQPLIHQDADREHIELVKAADLLSAYAKSLAELRANNTEFRGSCDKLEKVLNHYRERLPEVAWFMERLMPAFNLTIDDLVDVAFASELKEGQTTILERRLSTD